RGAPRAYRDRTALLRGAVHPLLQPGACGLPARKDGVVPSAPAVATGYGARLTVDLAALRRNWTALDLVSRCALTGAVVKGDAYGTGLSAARRAFYEAGARFFFAATPDEAI